MGVWRNQLLPRLIDVTLRSNEISKWRRRCIDGMHGVVVEPGFGSGLNMAHLPDDVTKVYAVDPAVVGQKIAAGRVAESPVQVAYVGLDGQKLDLAENSCDAGLVTFTLCTIPDSASALAELRRVIKPGGRLHFLEHGSSPDAGVRRMQDRLTPVQKRIADGCHLNRDIVGLIADAGFEIDWSDASYAGRPKFGSYFFVGQAIN